LISGSLMTRNRQRCVLPPLGAQTPACRIFRTSSSGTGSGFKRRMARMVCMMSNRSVPPGILPSDCSNGGLRAPPKPPSERAAGIAAVALESPSQRRVLVFLDLPPRGGDLRRRGVHAREIALRAAVPALRVLAITLQDVDDAVEPGSHR